MIGTPESAFLGGNGGIIMSPRPRLTNSPFTRAWNPMREAGSLWVRLRAPFARRRYAAEFERFTAFVGSFPEDRRRPLAADESQAWADNAVLLGLLDVDPTFWTAASRPNFYRLVPGYRRRKSEPKFRQWLVLHERRTEARRVH